MSLKENLIMYMKEKGITIRELSEKTEISEPTLKRLRSTDNANPTLDVLMKISTTLGIPLSDLIQDKKQTPLFYQDRPLPINNDTNEFVLVFTRDTFSFPKGTKAVFRKYIPNQPITKYIINKDGTIFEKVEGEKGLFRDENFNNYSIKQDLIFAFIIKELYEVNYV